MNLIKVVSITSRVIHSGLVLAVSIVLVNAMLFIIK